MNKIQFSDIRESFTDIAQRAQFGKETFLLTKNNKPAVGIVPVEFLMLMSEIVEKASVSKDIAEITEKYMLLLDPEDMDYIKSMIKNPPKANNRMQASMRAAKKKFMQAHTRSAKQKFIE